MQRTDYMESAIHGTWDFPVAVYYNRFPPHASTLAPLHYHEEFEFLVVMEGEMAVQMEYETYTLAAQEGIFINSNTLHKITALDSNKESAFLAVVFHYQLLCPAKDIVFQKYIAPILARELYIPPIIPSGCAEILKKLQDDFTENKFGMEIRVKEELLFCMEQLIQKAVPMTSNRSNPKGKIVKSVIRYIEAHFTESITLEDLCKEIHMSKEYLCRVFKELSGMPPMVYRNEYRIRRSRELLTESQLSITEIASQCGFNSTSYFNKLFLRYTNCTPNEYRKSHNVR